MKSNTSLLNVSTSDLRKALALRESIERQNNELTALLTGQTVAFSGLRTRATRKGRKIVKHRGRRKGAKLSDADKARIAKGLRESWARRKAAAQPVTPATTAPVTSTPAPVSSGAIPEGAEAVRFVKPNLPTE